MFCNFIIIVFLCYAIVYVSKSQVYFHIVQIISIDQESATNDSAIPISRPNA